MLYDDKQKRYTSVNDVTGDLIKTKPSTEAYSEGWDRIFGSKKETQQEEGEQTD